MLKLVAGYYLAQLRRRAIGPHARAILTDSWNGRLLVSSGDLVVGKSLAFGGSYERSMITAILERLSVSSKVLVVGAHVGAVLVPIARRCTRVVGVEANPHTFELLALNVTINDLSNVRLLKVAAGDRKRMVDFFASYHNTGGSKVILGAVPQVWAYTYDSPERLSVEMNRLDDVITEREFDLIVMDIEGSEAIALQGMPEILASSRSLLVEFLPHHLENVAQTGPKGIIDPVAELFEGAYAPFADKRQREYCRAEFNSSLISDVYRLGGADVLFFRSNASARKVCAR